MENQPETVDRLIRIDEVLHICGLSRSSLYASIQKGEFPSQVKLSQKASAWVHSEVLAWAKARVALRRLNSVPYGQGISALTSAATRDRR